MNLLFERKQIPRIVVTIRNSRNSIDRLEPISLPWAQGVGRSNRPAPTNENKGFICNAGFGAASAPVAACGILKFLEASNSYNFDYRRFSPSCERADPQSRMRLVVRTVIETRGRATHLQLGQVMRKWSLRFQRSSPHAWISDSSRKTACRMHVF